MVRPGEDGKLRLGGGGGGDLEGFSVRYRGTVSSSREGSDSDTFRINNKKTSLIKDNG